MDYLVLAFYVLKKIDRPQTEIKHWKRFLEERSALGRIYINEKGINAQMSISAKNASVFYDWFLSDKRYQGTDIKIHRSLWPPFPKLTIKYRKQLAAIDKEYDLSNRGQHLSSDEWAKMIEEGDENTVLLDVRNDYEWEVGHFEGAEKPPLKTFREFPEYARKLQKLLHPEKARIMMYCTGGIRCELYSCIVKEEGFKQVYQLKGGIIKYGLEKGTKHWRGNLFVFDDRLVVPISEKEKSAVISQCVSCGLTTDAYYNCANMDCNTLFISCISCATHMKGCCQDSCMKSPRVRLFQVQNNPRPFRKLSFEEKTKLSQGKPFIRQKV